MRLNGSAMLFPLWSRHLTRVNKSTWPSTLSFNWCVGDQGWWGVLVPKRVIHLWHPPPPVVPCDTFHMVELLVGLCDSPDVKAEKKNFLTKYLISFHYIFIWLFPLWQWKKKYSQGLLSSICAASFVWPWPQREDLINRRYVYWPYNYFIFAFSEVWDLFPLTWQQWSSVFVIYCIYILITVANGL